MTHTNAPHSSLALLPFLLAAAVSATFSGVFFWTLGTTPFESALFVSVALALELAKGVFLRRAGAGRGQRVFRVGMIGLLILFSITASVALGVSRLEGAIEQQALADRETRQIDTMLEQLNEQEAALRENLSELPIEWRITKNEYVDQLEQIRSDQSALMGRRAMLSRSADSSRMNVGAVWITTADVLRSEPDTLLMGFLVAVAVALELVIVGS